MPQMSLSCLKASMWEERGGGVGREDALLSSIAVVLIMNDKQVCTMTLCAKTKWSEL